MSKIVLFDMDGTLTLPRAKIQHGMIRVLRELSASAKIGIVTGSDFEYVMQQCGDMFDMSGIPVDKVDIFPCNGTKHYTWKNNKFEKVFDQGMIKEIGQEKYQFLLQTILSFQLLITLRNKLPYTGTFFHYRGSMLNWCPIGRAADTAARNAWVECDKEKKIRVHYIKELKDTLDKKDINLCVTLGGSTSFDIYPEGWDKTFVMNHLSEYKEIIFVGDAVEEGQNDHTLYQLLKDGEYTQSYATTDPIVTAKIVDMLILPDIRDSQ